LICDYLFVDNVAHVHHAIMDMMADVSYHLPSDANQICLSIVKAVSEELRSPSQDSVAFCGWLVNQLEQIVDQSFSITTS